MLAYEVFDALYNYARAPPNNEPVHVADVSVEQLDYARRALVLLFAITGQCLYVNDPGCYHCAYSRPTDAQPLGGNCGYTLRVEPERGGVALTSRWGSNHVAHDHFLIPKAELQVHWDMVMDGGGDFFKDQFIILLRLMGKQRASPGTSLRDAVASLYGFLPDDVYARVAPAPAPVRRSQVQKKAEAAPPPPPERKRAEEEDDVQAIKRLRADARHGEGLWESAFQLYAATTYQRLRKIPATELTIAAVQEFTRTF